MDNIEKLQCLTFEAEVEARIRLNWKNELRWFPNTSLTNDLTNFWINCKLGRMQYKHLGPIAHSRGGKTFFPPIRGGGKRFFLPTRGGVKHFFIHIICYKLIMFNLISL